MPTVYDRRSARIRLHGEQRVAVRMPGYLALTMSACRHRRIGGN